MQSKKKAIPTIYQSEFAKQHLFSLHNTKTHTQVPSSHQTIRKYRNLSAVNTKKEQRRKIRQPERQNKATQCPRTVAITHESQPLFTHH